MNSGGYTQQRLAQELGVEQPRIAQIESAGANLQIDTLDRLAAVFRVEPARLLQPDRTVIALHAGGGAETPVGTDTAGR